MNKAKILRPLGLTAIAMAALLCVSCHGNEPLEEPETRNKVLILYECGFNSLCFNLKSDIFVELQSGSLPKKTDGTAVLVYSKLANSYQYAAVPSYITRHYSDDKGINHIDTLKTFPSSTIATSPETMREVLNYVKSEFPSSSYGMIFSSHGSGWLPAGYYSSPSTFEREHQDELPEASAVTANALSAKDKLQRAPVPEGSLEDDPYRHMVRSLGEDKSASGSIEMNVNEFVSGLPFKLDYLFFDMCLTAGVEVVYGLRDCADYIGVSPAEVLADGMFDYTKLTSYLLNNGEPLLTELFEDSFERYNAQSGQNRSSTVNLIKTSGLDNLAFVCRTLIEKYADDLAAAPYNDIQGYFRNNMHYFYDLRDIFAKCGASEEDLAALDSAIDGCVVYKNATPYFLNVFTIDPDRYSGFSMYLPCAGTELLDLYYKEEAWNDAVGLVK